MIFCLKDIIYYPISKYLANNIIFSTTKQLSEKGDNSYQRLDGSDKLGKGEMKESKPDNDYMYRI